MDDMNPNPVPSVIPDYNSYITPSYICYGSYNTFDMNVHPYICSLFDAAYEGTSYDNWGGDPDKWASVDVTDIMWTSESPDTDGWNVAPSENNGCSSGNNVLEMNCESNGYCLESGKYCAMDLDCCQYSGQYMFCHPVWGTCYQTV